MKFKKFASLALAGAMSLSLAVPALASDNSTEITGSFTNVDIEVTVSPTASAFINPYGLDLKVLQDNEAADPDNAAKTTISGQQIVSTPMFIKNESAMDLQVAASMTASVKTGSTMRFSSSTTGGVGATKAVFAYLQAKQSDLTGTSASGGGVELADIAGAVAAWGAPKYTEGKDLVVSTALAATTDNFVIVRAATMDSNGDFASYSRGSVALVRLTGDCTTSPTTATWSDDDGFTVNVAYTFKPVALADYTVTCNTADFTVAAGAPNTVNAPSAVSAASTAKEGDLVTVTVTLADAGDVLTPSVKMGTTEIDTSTVSKSGTTATFTFVMPAGNVTVSGTVSDT